MKRLSQTIIAFFFMFFGLSTYAQFFDAGEEIIVGDRPVGINTADLDGDGDLDVIGTLYGEGKVVWNENLGNGVFGPTQLIDSVNGPWDVAAADIDGDGDLDVVSANEFDFNLTWFENLGGGNFGTQIEIGYAWGPVSLDVADLDDDGDVDVVCATWSGDDFLYFENLGSGTFAASVEIDGFADKGRTIQAVDLDGDGDLDLLGAAEATNMISWYENLGGATFGPRDTISNSMTGTHCAYAEDLDNDGDADVIATGFYSGGIVWFENLGGGTFGPSNLIANAYTPWTVFPSDLDGDGDMDLLAALDIPDKIVWYESFGDGTFGAENVISATVDRPFTIVAADLDGDGDDDVLNSTYQSGEISWYENQIPESCSDVPINLSHYYTAGPTGTFYLSWYGIPNALGYQVRVKRVSSVVPKVKMFISPNNSLTISGVFQEGDVFKWKVRAACPSDTSDWSERATFVAPALREDGIASYEELSAGSISVQLYPNPAAEKIQLLFESEGIYQLNITDESGRQVYHYDGIEGEIGTKVDLKGWPTGTYLYRLEMGGKVSSGSFIKL